MRDGFSRPSPFSRSTTTDGQGDFEITGLPRMEVDIQVEVEWGRLAKRRVNLTGTDLQTLAEPLFIEGERGVVAGRVAGDDELGGIQVQLSEPVFGRVAEGRTEPQGTFYIWGLQEQSIYALRLLRDGELLWQGAVSLADAPLHVDL